MTDAAAPECPLSIRAWHEPPTCNTRNMPNINLITTTTITTWTIKAITIWGDPVHYPLVSSWMFQIMLSAQEELHPFAEFQKKQKTPVSWGAQRHLKHHHATCRTEMWCSRVSVISLTVVSPTRLYVQLVQSRPEYFTWRSKEDFFHLYVPLSSTSKFLSTDLGV